jgi:hypothetical protein
MRPSRCRLIVLLLLALGGCVVPDEMRTVPISEGRVVDIPMGPQGPRNGRGNGYEVLHVWFSPGVPDREIIYQFAVSVPPAVTLQSVKVEDISDEHAYLLIDDQHPWVTDGHWMIDTLPIKAEDPRLGWVYHITPSLRVYRFTIIDSANRRTVLYQVATFSNGFKYAIRHKWGEKD